MYTHQYSITIFLQQWWLLGVQELMHNCFSCDLFYLHCNRSFWCQPVATSVLGVSLRPFGRLSLRRLHPRRAARRPWAARGVRDVRGARGCGQFRWRGWWHCSEHELPAWGFYPWTLEQAAQMKKRESLEVMVEGNDELSVINETDLKVIKENKLMENDPRLKKYSRVSTNGFFFWNNFQGIISSRGRYTMMHVGTLKIMISPCQDTPE